jgi:hypothetical protein
VTWHQLKVASLQKLFAIDGSEIPANDSVSQYLAAMPQAANEAILLLAQDGRPLRASIDITQTAESSGRHDLSALAPDFFALVPPVYRTDANCRPTSDYALEDGGVLLLPKGESGVWRVYYDTYPKTITSATTDDFAIPLPEDAAVILPLYIASQLYKDDDFAQSVQYRNEFEAARAVLIRNRHRHDASGGFYSVTNWW